MTLNNSRELLNRIKEDLKNTLSEKRYNHSIRVMDKAIELAKIYNEDEGIVTLTALTHDIAKEMSHEEFFQYAEQYGIELEEIDKIATMVLHGKIGADIVKRKYGFTKEMQDAICYHTTGRPNMTMLDKIIYIADKIEEGRDHDKVKEIKKVLEKQGLDEAILYDIDNFTIHKMLEKQRIIHPYSIYTRNHILYIREKEN